MEAIAWWKTGQIEEAVNQWRTLTGLELPIASSALGALILSNQASENEWIRAVAIPLDEADPILSVALMRRAPSDTLPLLKQFRSDESLNLMNQQVARIFPLN